jgi:hypothetical protein
MKDQNKYPVKGALETRKGVFTYQYTIYHSKRYHADFYMFDIWDERDDSPDLHKFSFCFEIMENSADLKVTDLFAGDYKGKGISIPMILKAKELFGKRIISTSNKKPARYDEANWEGAIKKVWKPMVSQGLASYHQEDDYYFV